MILPCCLPFWASLSATTQQVGKAEDAALFSIRFFEFRVSGKIFDRVKYLKGYSFNFAGM